MEILKEGKFLNFVKDEVDNRMTQKEKEGFLFS